MRILVLDDEPVILQGMQQTIRRAIPDAEIIPFAFAEKALAWCRENSADIIFLDIEMPELNGMQLAKELRTLQPQMNIIFTTSYPEYAVEAYELRASGYLLKPVSESDVLREVENLRFDPGSNAEKKLRLVTFGNFMAYVGNEHLHFRYTKTLELLAYLTDRNGAFCTNGELEAVLWEDMMPSVQTASYLRQIRKDLVDTLDATGCYPALQQQRGRIRILPEAVQCDYYDALKGDIGVRSRYKGEYMSQYSWAETTNGWLYRHLMEGNGGDWR